ncbi:Protein R03G8.3 [Aphelenchoides avenae]|nr:Protein R03G8.3 [Aphelenchus avenae]
MNGFCYKHLDNETFIGFEYQRKGYVTMMSEDWAAGVFNWPNCKGFAKPPVDHYMRPFQLRVENRRYKDDLGGIVYKRSCKEPHHYQLDYLKDFINAYPDRPKFSITWMSYVAHDDANGLYHVDGEWHRFFRDYKRKLRNSYLFVMGDHGNRFGYLRSTRQGEIEDNNPALVVAVPHHLRKNYQLLDNLRANSKVLTTHYDTYATLTNIANVPLVRHKL